jgi:hypothetical protein
MDRVKGEHGTIEALAARATASLTPEDDDLVPARCNDPRFHAALRLAGLQRRPRVDPRWGLGPEAAAQWTAMADGQKL